MIERNRTEEERRREEAVREESEAMSEDESYLVYGTCLL